MGMLIGYFDIDSTLGGWLMSAFSFVGIALSIPAAIILKRAGARIAETIAIGAALGSLSSASWDTASGVLVAMCAFGLTFAVAARSPQAAAAKSLGQSDSLESQPVS